MAPGHSWPPAGSQLVTRCAKSPVPRARPTRLAVAPPKWPLLPALPSSGLVLQQSQTWGPATLLTQAQPNSACSPSAPPLPLPSNSQA